MKICIYGLWHLGSVTAACLAELGHDVVGLDDDPRVVAQLKRGKAPIHEPGLDKLLRRGMARGRLSFTTVSAKALRNAEAIWITFDTPVDEDDRSDVAHVTSRVHRIFPHLAPGALVIVSSQLPVGTVRRLEDACRVMRPDAGIAFCCIPENLRLGRAIDSFRKPGRIVVGLRTTGPRPALVRLLRGIDAPVEWVGVESAEMVKHALNAFLAVSVVFANEIAVLCERTGADAKEVERGLKTDQRIGPRAYLAPGAAFAGGTLARDVVTLSGMGRDTKQPVPLLDAILESNEAHKRWMGHKLVSEWNTLTGRTVAVLGLTYKPGTNTLRRSLAVDFCRWLREQDATVRMYDPAIPRPPRELRGIGTLCNNAIEACRRADAVVIATEWPEFLDLKAGDLIAVMRETLVIDPNRFLVQTLGGHPGIRYSAVGLAAGR